MKGGRSFTVAALLALSIVGWACSSEDRVVIGSKNFTEQIILGELLAQQIEKQTDLQVDRRFNLGGTFICDQALRSGDVDVYVEYTGTALTAILEKPPVHDRQEAYETVRQDYANSGIEWLEPLGFNNTFAILIRGEEARRLNLHSISEAARYTPQWRAGFGYEFLERGDGLKGLIETYDLDFAAPPRVMELGLIYRALAEKAIDLTAGNSTDGLIDALDLFALEDDKNYFPPYDAVPLIRRQTLDRHPTLRSVLSGLGGRISEEEMRRLNYAVDGERQLVKEVVAEFLASWQ